MDKTAAKISPYYAAAVLSIVSIFALFSGCSPYQRTPYGTYDIPFDKLPKEIGPWTNDYAGNSNLAGVIVNQYGEGPEPKAPYAHHHPAVIWYVFWNGDVRSIEYSPDGTAGTPGLWAKYLTKNSPFWKGVDFAYGSDPTFAHHSDPRRKHRASHSYESLTSSS